MNKHRTHLAQTMSYTNVRVHNSLMQQIEAHKTGWQSTTAIVNDLIASALDTSFRLDGATEPASGQHSLGRSPSKSSSLNKRDKDVPKSEKEVPGNLWGHAEKIHAYWKAKPKTKTDAAWKLLMSELTKIQEAHGDRVIDEQLVLAEANRWQGITLANYERFGVNKPNTATQASGLTQADYDAMNALKTPW